MVQINVRVPEDLREEAKRTAEQQDVSLNQFCALAIARAVGEAKARRFFAQRAGGLSPDEGRKRFLDVLNRVQP